ncbi:DinB family protein [bacterium]|nr:DinB family protein [bacterium]
MISKQDLLKLAKKEFSTTLKVLKAFPPEMKEFRPHERSSNAIQLTSTFVFEMYLFSLYIFGETIDPSRFQTYKPDSIQSLINDFERESQQTLARLEQMPETVLSKTVEFAGHTFNADEFALMMICDQIHHRGQLTIYVRMAGGKVPSVYGPSADDPSTNF